MLDPSISLDYQAPQMPDFSKYAQQAMNTAVGAQQIQASQQAQATSAAQEQNLQAQNPGLVAQSNSLEAKAALDQQDKAAMDYANSIAPKYTTHNADGSVTFDALSAGNDMAANGFVKQGGQYVKQWADGVSANTDSIKKLQDNTADLQKSQLQMAGPILNAAAQEPDPVKRAALLDQGLAGAESSYPQLFPKGSTSYLETLFNRAKVDPTGAASYATTPKEWIQQGIDKQNAESTRIAAVASQTNAATQALQQQMGPVDAVNAIMGNSSILDNGSAAIQQLRDSNGNLPAGYAGVTGENLKQKILSDPKLTAIAGSIEAAKKLGQTIDYSGGFEGVQQQLRLISQTGKDAAYRINKTQDAAGRSIAGGAPITPTAPTAGTVPTIRIQMPDGRTGTIPATSWGKYMAMGATKVTQ